MPGSWVESSWTPPCKSKSVEVPDGFAWNLQLRFIQVGPLPMKTWKARSGIKELVSAPEKYQPA